MSPRRFVFAIPGDLATPTGGYVYDRNVIEQLPHHGWDVTVLRLGDSFPYPTPDDMNHAASVLSDVPGDAVLMVDGLALGALETSALDRVTAPIVALVHHPLAWEGNLDDVTRQHFHARERENLARCRHVIVTSPPTAELLQAHYDVDAAHITVARPGTDASMSPRSPSNPPLLLSVGSLIPRKGHDVLLRALASLLDLPWRAIIAGEARDAEYAASLKGLLVEHELEKRVSLAGSVSATELESLYAQATVFVLATRFEGHGMVFDEAMGHGLPIVTCHTGAVPNTVAPGAGLLVPVDDPNALANALRSLLTDEALRQGMSEASASAGLALPRWSDTAETVARALDRLTPGTIDS